MSEGYGVDRGLRSLGSPSVAQPSTPVLEWAAPTGLDSGEPRWRRSMLNTAIDPTARNSDCQFCSVLAQKSGPRTYWPHDCGSWRRSRRYSSDDAHPATDCTVHDARKMPPITRDNDHENSPVRNPHAEPADCSSCDFVSGANSAHARPEWPAELRPRRAETPVRPAHTTWTWCG